MVDVADKFDLICPSLSYLPNVAKQILSFANDDRVILFHGEVGAGKTTLIKEICRQLEVVDAMSSPTFSIINEYESREENPVYHFDFYRVNSTEEAREIGVSEYFYSGYFCLIEWPEIVLNLLPANYTEVFVQVGENESRNLEIRKNG